MNAPRRGSDDPPDTRPDLGLGVDPIAEVQHWLDDAAASGAIEPTAMALATRSGEDIHNRIVLLRGLDARGLRFYSSYSSVKGRDLDLHPRAAAVLWWGALERQVRVEGTVSRLSEDESDAYFAARPRGHQLAAWASEQSEAISERGILAERFKHFEGRFEGSDVPRPHSWGGYLLRPVRIEFWHGRPDRLHDRIEYRRVDAGWTIARLQP